MDLPLTIRETQDGLKEKKFKASDLTAEYLKNISDKNKDLNAFLTITEERAFEDAKKVDSLINQKGEKAFEEFPLLGVSLAHKDLYLTEGIRTTAASKILESYIPAYSSTVAKRLEDAGSILLGKTNCDAWAHGASGENSDFGPTKNPWNREFVPGGSSSGSAAAEVANLTLVATGTDTGGSIREPANFCGVFGLKPTYGAVSRYGVIAMASSLDCMGVFGRTTDDVEAVFKVTRGADGFDSTVIDADWETSEKKKFKIGIPKEYFIKGIDSEVEQKVREATKLFESEGVELVEISLPHTKDAISVYYIIQPAEVSSNLGRYDGIRYGNSRETFGEEAKRRIMLGTYVLSAGYYDAYYLKAMKVRSKIIEDFDNAFLDVDAIIAPVSPTPAFKLGEKASDPLQMYLADVFTVSANLAGIPGLSVPFGFTKSGLPLGFQILGKRFSESTLFELSRKFEKISGYQPSVAK